MWSCFFSQPFPRLFPHELCHSNGEDIKSFTTVTLASLSSFSLTAAHPGSKVFSVDNCSEHISPQGLFQLRNKDKNKTKVAGEGWARCRAPGEQGQSDGQPSSSGAARAHEASSFPASVGRREPVPDPRQGARTFFPSGVSGTCSGKAGMEP